MSPNPKAFLAHLKQEGYHSRSNKHSNCFCECLVRDLLHNCPNIEERASAGQLVYDLNFTIFTGTSEWNVDLVFGEPPLDTDPPESDVTIIRTAPSTVQIAVEIKAVMTEHRKAVKNRKRDLEAHHDHVHRYSAKAIAGGVLLINSAPVFKSPLRAEPTRHHEPDTLVKHCIDQLRAVATRTSADGAGLDAKAAIVLDMDNMTAGRARYGKSPPAPAVGDPMHYDAFVQAICNRYSERFCG